MFKPFTECYGILTNCLNHFGVLSAVTELLRVINVNPSRRPDIYFHSKVLKLFSGRSKSLNRLTSKYFHNEVINLLLEPASALKNCLKIQLR